MKQQGTVLFNWPFSSRLLRVRRGLCSGQFEKQCQLQNGLDMWLQRFHRELAGSGWMCVQMPCGLRVLLKLRPPDLLAFLYPLSPTVLLYKINSKPTLIHINIQPMGNRNGQQASPSKLWVRGQDLLPLKTTCFWKYNFRYGEAVDIGFSVCFKSCHWEAEKMAW